MQKNIRFTFLCSEVDKKRIYILSRKYDRSKSDAIRFLLKQAVGQISEKGEAIEEKQLEKVIDIN